MKKIEINAEGEKLGRLASKAASFLMGKDTADFTKNRVPEIEVKITNASKLQITDAKKGGKVYTRYSGYPSGLKKEKMGKLIERKGYGEVVKKAVYGMLSDNKLRPKMMKHLIIEE
ncbi:MAG: uL13 family ribosomal protein [Candidatus Pacebacteria bacterium]|jgi:large subunit ribosomal protein L13|nr:uL13 family ribosomal protein [Candidatus Paceibacterota bacterium]|tara:strand:+ start:69480 stop:69827 length:348 start_codon:yes stop_codon:yes gene_type:complete